MKVLVTGATGLVGSQLLAELFVNGTHSVNILTRNPQKAQEQIPFPVNCYEWNINKNYIDPEAFAGVDVVIHLAGENIAAGRWTTKQKDKILNSRSKGTELLINAINKLSDCSIKKVISTSAIGIYGHRGDESISEDADHGSDFLAKVCKQWEAPLTNLNQNIKKHIIRVGLVLSEKGGALTKMLPAFQMGVAGNLGSGKQMMSWIHIEDLVAQFIYLLENEGKHEVYNGVSPQAVSNKVFTKTLGGVLSRPTLLPAPAFALKIILGEMSSLLLNGQNVYPQNMIDEGFQFKYAGLEDALKHLLRCYVNGSYQLTQYQWIDQDIERVFDFFSSEKNLEVITPEYLGFKVLQKSTPEIEKGTVIDYKLKLHGLPMKWKSRIENFEPLKTFTDVQLTGPYTSWIHHHDFFTSSGGTLMRDDVTYKLPMGFLGRIFAGHFVKKDVQTIFSHRKKVLKEVF